MRIIQPHTDVALGDCNYLDTCNHMRTCKRVHYELDPTSDIPFPMGMGPGGMGALPPPRPVPGYLQVCYTYIFPVSLGDNTLRVAPTPIAKTYCDR